MSLKAKVIIGGFGLIGLNVCVLALLALWPVEQENTTTVIEVPVEQEAVVPAPPSSVGGGGEGVSQILDLASTSVPTSNLQDAKTTVDMPAGPVQSPQNNTTQAVVAEVDSYHIPVYTEGTVLTAMQAYRDTSDFTYTGKEYPGIGLFVESIGGKPATREKYWILYVNGETSDLGASQATVRPGDSVEWRFEKSFY